MNGSVKILLVLLLGVVSALGADNPVAEAVYARRTFR